MRFFRLGFLMFLMMGVVCSQEWDPIRQATGWSRQDKDGSFTFYEPVSKTLQTWAKDTGISNALNLAKLKGLPEKWVLDSYNNAWIVVGNSLIFVDKSGKVGKTIDLPAPVGDLAWDVRGFVLSYRTDEPFLEKRDYRGGRLQWSYGLSPSLVLEVPPSRVVHRIALNGEGQVLLAEGNTMNLTFLDGMKGKKINQTSFNWKGGPLPTLDLQNTVRGPLCWWMEKNMALMALAASQLPLKQREELSGLVLFRLDPVQNRLDVAATGLNEDHLLVGATETEAVLLNPKGGLAFVSIR